MVIAEAQMNARDFGLMGLRLCHLHQSSAAFDSSSGLIDLSGMKSSASIAM